MLRSKRTIGQMTAVKFQESQKLHHLVRMQMLGLYLPKPYISCLDHWKGRFSPAKDNHADSEFFCCSLFYVTVFPTTSCLANIGAENFASWLFLPLFVNTPEDAGLVKSFNLLSLHSFKKANSAALFNLGATHSVTVTLSRMYYPLSERAPDQSESWARYGLQFLRYAL